MDGADTPALDGAPLRASPPVNIQPLDNHDHARALTLLRYAGERLRETEQNALGQLVLLATDVIEGKRAWG